MELVKLLLDHGAVINAAPAASGGITALPGAAIRGHINIAQMLIENGAEVNALPALKDGRTAIDGAAEHGRLDAVGCCSTLVLREMLLATKDSR
jgi:ankyrin repeat protein